jgi:hypothetical protein
MGVARLHWTPGPKKLGCVYHQRGVCPRLGGESLVVDVFVMPRIARKRPVALTVCRYRNYRPALKREWQLRDPKNTSGVAIEVAGLFEQVGAPSTVAVALGTDVERFLVREARTLQKVLHALSPPAA